MTPKKLQNWRKSLGIVDLKSTDYICHLHFKKEDVTMFEKNKTNGEVQILKTGKTTLNDKALPSVNHQFTPTPEHKLARKPDSSCFQTQNSNKEVFVDQETDDPYMDKTEHFSDPLLDNVSNTTKTSQNIEKWVNNKKILKLPPTWMYVRKENRVEYERINLNTGAARNLVRFNMDASITVTFLPNNKEIILKKKIDSFKNIYDCLKYIERIRLCAGTRIHNKRSVYRLNESASIWNLSVTKKYKSKYMESKMSRQSQRKFEMRCCVPLCKNDADTIPKNSDISFHMFPESTELRKFWLEALDLTDWFEKDVNTAINSVVCSEHFSSADIYSTKSGFRKLRIGAVPLVIQESLDDDTLAEVPEQLKICRICLDTDCKMFSMNQYKLEEVYQNMTGFSMGEDERVSQTFCVECAHRLVTFDKFREKSLQADLLLSELLKKTKSVLFQSLKEEVMKIDRKNFGLTSNLGEKLLSYDAFDLYIQEDTQIEPNIECETYDDQDNISKKENYTVYFDKSNANVQTEGTPTKNIKHNSPIVPVGAKQQPTSKSNASQTPNTTTKSIVHQTTAKTNKSNVLPQTTTKNETHTVSTPKTKNTQIKQLQPIVNRNVKPYQPIHTPQKNMKTYKNVKRLAEIENPVVVKQEVVTENNESMQVDYIPVIDVVIDNKFKIVRKEDLLLKNAQLVIANKQTPNKDGDGNRAIVNDNHNTPVGNNPNLNNSVVKEKKVLPIMKGDRIIMPNENKDNEENQTEMPILQTILTQKASKTQENADKSKSVEIEIPDINDDGNNTSDTYEVPVTGYVEQEYYEESIVETVNSDYLDLHSEDDELLNIKREVEQIVKEERDMTGVSDIKEDPELWDEDNNEDNEDNEPVDDSWGQDDFSEEEENEEEENSEDGENGETENFKAVRKLSPDAAKRAKISRKRKTTMMNYGKTYFYDDLNDVIFTIQELSHEEQLIEIRNRRHGRFKDAQYTCDLCYRGFMHKYAFDRHIAAHANNVGSHECGVCRFRFGSAKQLEVHTAARHANKFSCNLCDFTTTSSEPARQHGMKHRGIKYQCPHCSEEAIRYTVLMDHIAIKHTPESLCTVCGLKLLNDEELERHKQVRHSGAVDWENATKCTKCDLVFSCVDAYRLHLGVSIKHDSEFISEHLKARKNQEADFERTASQYKKSEFVGPLTCEQCGESQPTLRKYHAHFRREHPDKTRTFYPTMKKKIMCETCGRFFKAQWQYLEHLRLHTNERPYACDICGKTFITNRLLGAHRYVHGLGRTRPDIRCTLCGKSFANRGNLHRHMGVHSDEKRFKCEICNTAYRQKAEMKSHYDHVHLRKPWPKRHRPKRDERRGRRRSVETSEDDNSQTVIEEVVEEMEIEY